MSWKRRFNEIGMKVFPLCMLILLLPVFSIVSFHSSVFPCSFPVRGSISATFPYYSNSLLLQTVIAHPAVVRPDWKTKCFSSNQEERCSTQALVGHKGLKEIPEGNSDEEDVPEQEEILVWKRQLVIGEHATTSTKREGFPEKADPVEKVQRPGEKKEIMEEARKEVQAIFGEPNMDQPPQNATTKQRLRWLKLNWFKLNILHSDKIATQFDQRMRAFLSREVQAVDWAAEQIVSNNFNNVSEGNLQLGDSVWSSCSMRFFMIWIASLKSFGPREHLSLESVFKTHPLACLVIISRTFDSPEGNRILRPFLTMGFRVTAIAPDLPLLFKGTPALEWYRNLKQGKIDPGAISLSQNLSNLIRLAVLYRYGGTYIDTDIVVMNDLSHVSNTIGAQSIDTDTRQWKRLNNAVMAFDEKHPLLLKFIEEFSFTFNGSKWGYNGPYLVSRVVKRVHKRSGYGCKVLGPIAFYPVDWEHIQSLFRAPKCPVDQKWQIAKMQQLTKEALTVHLWNKQSRSLEIEPGSIMDLIFQQRCKLCEPGTLAAARSARTS